MSEKAQYTIVIDEMSLERLGKCEIKLRERLKIKYSVPPDSIRDGSDLRIHSQHMVDVDDLISAVSFLETILYLARKNPAK